MDAVLAQDQLMMTYIPIIATNSLELLAVDKPDTSVTGRGLLIHVFRQILAALFQVSATGRRVFTLIIFWRKKGTSVTSNPLLPKLDLLLATR